MKKNETIKDIRYDAGSRIATVEQVVTKADDYAEVGNLYFRLSDLYRRLEADIDEGERTALEKDLTAVRLELDKYLGYLEGYDE